jgi:VIT1/CCC1 family predicted Fe2+/Mn2+ transporter
MPIKCGIATFIAFLVSSTISFSPYLVTWGVQKSPDHPWIPVLCISTVQLISLGIAQAKIIGIRAWKSATQFFILGVVATSIGYGIGQIMPS